MRSRNNALFGRAWTLTCSSCRHGATPPQTLSQRFASTARRVHVTTKQRSVKPAYFAAAGGSLLGASFLLTDEIKHGYTAAERSGRVLTTLAVCVTDYRTTLRKKYDDPEEATSKLKACHKRCAERTLKVLEKNGSIFIKLGQHLSSMGYLLPTEWTTTFIPLQDKCPVSPLDSIEDMFIRDTGLSIQDRFDDFSREPIGAASLAQVHTAYLKGTRRKVAVKVQHPHLEEWVPLDLALTRFTFHTLARMFPDYDLSWLSDEMEFSLPQELDFAREGSNAMVAKAYFKKNTNFPLIIPSVIDASKRILVMDYVTGCRPDNIEYLDAHNISRVEVSATFARVINTMIFAPGAPLHCDLHGGNVAILPNPNRRYPYNFDIIMYDHGLYRFPDAKLRRDYAHLWLAVIDADEKLMRKYAFDLAGITDQEFPLFASAITGRDYRVLTSGNIAKSNRDETEKDNISGALLSSTGPTDDEDGNANGTGDSSGGLLPQLVAMLGRVPRIILLILKTNDLTRSLDEGLQTGHGPERTFMILAKYASEAVLDEDIDNIKHRGGRGLWWVWPSNVVMLLVAYGRYWKVGVRLWGYERYLSMKRHLGYD